MPLTDNPIKMTFYSRREKQLLLHSVKAYWQKISQELHNEKFDGNHEPIPEVVDSLTLHKMELEQLYWRLEQEFEK